MKNDEIASLIAYPLFIVSLIWYALDEDFKKKKALKFHLKQGFILLIFWLIFLVLSYIPFIGGFIGVLGWVCTLILAVLGIINVINKKQSPLPVIGEYAKKLNF